MVATRTPFLGEGIRVRPLRPDAEAQAEEPEFVTLDPARRDRLIAFVENVSRMPDAAKARVLAQLQADRVPAGMVARLEARMGG